MLILICVEMFMLDILVLDHVAMLFYDYGQIYHIFGKF